MKANKYLYLWVVQGSYSQGWEDLCASEKFKEARDNLRDYRENEAGIAHRMIERRELNPKYTGNGRA